MQKWKEMIPRALEAQVEVLDRTRTQHLLVAGSVDNYEIARAHLEIADLLGQTINQYRRLLDKYRDLAK